MSPRIEVATDIAACALTVPIQAEVFKAVFAAGYSAMDFLRSADGRGAYLLEPGLTGAKLR